MEENINYIDQNKRIKNMTLKISAYKEEFLSKFVKYYF